MTIDRLSPAVRPAGRPAGFQRWRKLLFVHWEVDPDAVQATLPAPLKVDTHDGRALLGVVPFTMQDVTPWWSPSVPGVSNFHELNLRTYVTGNGVPGVWFYSLDAASTVAVTIARARWSLPYHRASMDLNVDGDDVHYKSRRLFPGPKPAELEARYTVSSLTGAADVDTLEHFLVERYVLFADAGNGRILSGSVHHEPYPLRDVELHSMRQTITHAAGFVCDGMPSLAHYSEGVDVDVYDLAAP
jgi:uncharacterized protein YqjF (DUF2071 family)